jgi:hypothetical protein
MFLLKWLYFRYIKNKETVEKRRRRRANSRGVGAKNSHLSTIIDYAPKKHCHGILLSAAESLTP